MAFGRRFKRAMRKVGKGVKKGATAVSNAVNTGPIAKARNAVAKYAKKIPVAKQFVEIGEFSNRLIIKGAKKAGIVSKKAKNPYEKAKNTKSLLGLAGGLPVKAKKLTLVAMTASPVVDKAMRKAGKLSKPPAAIKRAAKSAAKSLAAAAKRGSASAKKGLAIAAASVQVAKGKHATARKTLSAAKVTKGKKVTYQVKNLATGKVTKVVL